MAKSVDERVKEIIVEQLGVEEDDVTPVAKFIEDLGADSLDTVELVMALEEHFDIQIPDEDAEKIVTVGDAIQYIKDNSKNRGTASRRRHGAGCPHAGGQYRRRVLVRAHAGQVRDRAHHQVRRPDQ